jgi:hypothetical protein
MEPMIVRFTARGVALALPLLVSGALYTSGARADEAAANSCAAALPKDAKAIFDATLPQVGPGVDLRGLVTTNTRSLAMAGTIDRGSARQSAVAAAQCLERAGT